MAITESDGSKLGSHAAISDLIFRSCPSPWGSQLESPSFRKSFFVYHCFRSVIKCVLSQGPDSLHRPEYAVHTPSTVFFAVFIEDKEE